MSTQESAPTTSAVMTIKEVADVLGINPRTVSVGISDGTIPSVRVGRRILVPRARFYALLEPEPVK